MGIDPDRATNWHVSNLYKEKFALGSPLTLGLRKFNSFFNAQAAKRADHSFQKKLVRVAQGVVGIFAYPILGAFALIEIGLNEAHLRMHNKSVKKNCSF